MEVSWEEGLADHQDSLIYPGAFSQPRTLLRLFPQGKFPDNPTHLVTRRASGIWGLSELGGIYAWKGLDTWKGPCRACGGGRGAHCQRCAHTGGV